MANIELVIKIPEEIYQHYKRVWQKRLGSIPESCIAFGTPLPKGHGRIIDENQIRSVTICCDEERIDGWRLQHEYVDSTDAPTIVEADKAESEDKDEDSN